MLGCCIAAFCSILFYGVAAFLRQCLRPRRGFLAQCTAPVDLWECVQWWVGECHVWWSKFKRRVELCRRRRGTEGLCAVLIRLAMPNRAPAVELVTGQFHYGQLSVTLPYVRQRGWLWKTNVHGMPSQPICPTALVPVTVCKAPFTNLQIVAYYNLKRTHANSLCLPRKLIL